MVMSELFDGFDEILYERRRPTVTQIERDYAVRLHHLKRAIGALDLIDLYGNSNFTLLKEWLVDNVGKDEANRIMNENL